MCRREMPATNRPKLDLAGPGPPGRKTHGRYAVFLDRDGVIIHDNPAHICRLEQVQLLDGAAEAILRLNDAGCLVVVVTNQSGVARGFMTEADVRQINEHIADLVAQRSGARIDRVYYCPMHPRGVLPEYARRSFFRKPQPGMLLQAAHDLQLDLSVCCLIGDAETDMIAARRAGVCPILVLTGLQSCEHPRWTAEGRPAHVAVDLEQAVRWILQA